MARGPQSIAQPGGSVAIPYSATTVSIQTAINANPGATVFWIEKGGGTGVRAQTAALVPKSGNTFVFELGAILDGSTWVTSDATQASFRAHNENLDTVTIENAEIRYMPQKGIHAFRDFSGGWTVTNCEVHHCKDGISLAGGATVQRNVVHHNIGDPLNADPGLRGGGYVFNGAYGTTTAIVVDDNEFHHNGPEQKSIDVGVITWSNNYLHDEYVGIWADGDASGSDIHDNLIEDIVGAGIFWEQCRDGVIYTNTIRRTGEAAIFLSTSKDTEVYDNTIEDCYRGIQLFLNYTAINSQPWLPDLKNNNVHDNFVTLGTTSGSLANLLSYINTTDPAALAPYLVTNTKNNVFTDNTYTVPAGNWWLWGATLKTFTQWQAVPQDSAGVTFAGGGPGASIAVGSLLIAPYNPNDYGTFVTPGGVPLTPPTNDPLFDTDGFGTVTNGIIQLDNGRICVTNLGNFQVGVFNANGTLRAVNPVSDPCSIAGGYGNGFFYGVENYSDPQRIAKFSSDTAARITQWDLDSLGGSTPVVALAVTSGETFAYFARVTLGTRNVLRIDLGSSTVTTFITAPGVTTRVSGQNAMFCLRDNTLMVAWDDGTIVHYDTGGSVLHTYTRANVVAITPNLTDSSFWVSYAPSDWSIQEIEVATGTLLHDAPLPNAGAGVAAAHTGSAPGFNWGATLTVINTALGSTTTIPPGTPPSPVLVTSTPCCHDDAPPGTVPTSAGDVLLGFGWTPQCAGGGVVPSATPLTDSENWDV